MTERSEPPPEVVKVFFRTTSVTPSRPDIARTRPRLCEGVWTIDHGTTCCYHNDMTATTYFHSSLYVEPQDAGPTPAVRVWGKRECGRARARAGYF